MDAITQAWIRNRSDELAAANGCRFDVASGVYTVWWIERYCKLYEGEGNDGVPLVLRGCHQCGTYGLPAAIELEDFEAAKPHFLERAERHNECFRAGHFLDWQFECFVRKYGWVKPSAKWKREIRRFRESVVFVAKKCKKSPTTASEAFYLMTGDGEAGQKVFVCAKDGDQARRAIGDHAVKMYDQLDDDLRQYFTLNKNTLRISYLPTKSYMEPMSSSNSRTQESKEGLNGSCVTDEIHVVDRAFKERISRMNLSRSEPMDSEVSTAGDDPDSYGKERFDLALKVQSGEVERETMFVAIYAAPQNLKDKDLEADPLKYGRMANPAMGHTIDPEEYLRDYNDSKVNLRALSIFKKYRLNIWQQSGAPFLDVGAWDACEKVFAENDMAGMSCAAGMDLSLRWDMASVVLCFPMDDERYRLLPYFFLPQVGFDKLIVAQPKLLEWEREGFITVTPGSDLDYNFIKQTLAEKNDLFNIELLIYDPKYANHITQLIEEELGIERQEFAQALGKFAEPTAKFESLVIAGKLEHNGNPCAGWQIGHTNVEEKNGYLRPIKPPRNDTKKIDFTVAAIQALAGGMQIGSGDAWYTPGMFSGS